MQTSLDVGLPWSAPPPAVGEVPPYAAGIYCETACTKPGCYGKCGQIDGPNHGTSDDKHQCSYCSHTWADK
jgi:hypothetical protein